MSGARIRVFVVDDHPMIRNGLAAMIDGERDLERVGEAANGRDAVRLAATLAPDVVLMDLIMPGMDGIEATTQLRRQVPHAKIVILTSLLDAGEVRRAIDAGACGYVLKNASARELVATIRAAHAGRRVLAPEATDALIEASQRRIPGSDLTQRERELLALMTRGLNNQEIARELAIALPTVKYHVTNILAKLHADNRTEAVLTALKFKLIPSQ